MSKTDSNKVIEHLKKTWGDRNCPMCNHSDWQVADTIHELREYSVPGMMGTGHIVVVVPVICTTCGNTVLVNAAVAGVMNPCGGSQDVK